MAILEKRVSLGVKALEILCRFTITCYSCNKVVGNVCHCERWQVKFTDGLEIHFSVKDSLWSFVVIMNINEGVGLVQPCTLQFSRGESKEAWQ